MTDPLSRLALLQFDPTPSGMFAPAPPKLTESWPRRAVLCFFHEQLAALHDQGAARRVGQFSREMGGHDIFITDAPSGEPVAVFHPGVGAPAAVHALERVIAAGVEDVVVCGGAGALVPLALGHVVLPTSAVRHEGTSFHYAPPAETVEVEPALVVRMASLLDEREVPYAIGRTWTTDAPFRETPGVVATRRAEGCLTVEMEASALLTVARFRGVRLAVLLYAADDLSGAVWSSRGWTTAEARATLLRLAVDAVTRLGADH